MGKEYTPSEVAELLGLSVAEVRRCVRAGFLSPANAAGTLTFQDMVALRRAAQLVSAQMRPHRVRHALKALRDQLPENRPLSSVHVTVEGRSIVAREGGSTWNPMSGQFHLDFQKENAATTSAMGLSPTHASQAEALYEQGCDLEEGSPADAAAAYHRALEILPAHVDARINLGRILHAAGKLVEAETQYRRALESGPHSVASYNLAVALEDLGRGNDAINAYQAAIAADPNCEDAYFNLARIYERHGERAAALRALRTYRSLTRRS